jgi:phenylacetate-CoA ligase
MIGKIWDYYRQHTFIPSSRPRLLLDVVQPIEQVVDAINSYLPDVIVSYGSYLEAFFRTLKFHGTQMHMPSVFLYGGDSMSDGGRSLIEIEFGVPVLSVYDAVEAFKLGFVCEAKRGFHLHDDLCHVRIIDSNGNDLLAGEKGQVVISNLINRGTVLLNYCLGDLASLPLDRCPCGHALPLLSNLEGRAPQRELSIGHARAAPNAHYFSGVQ